MKRAIQRAVAVAVTVFLFALARPANAGQSPGNDLDDFMAKVLARRKVSEDAIRDYVLNETEQFAAIGPGQAPLFRSKREYLWYVRDGIHVRSPIRFDGVTINKDERKQYEDNWIKEEQQREKKKAEGKPAGAPAPAAVDATKPSLISQIAEPRFISEAYFLDFKFESGNYYLAGKEKLRGHDVLVIEYYPTNLFNDSDEKKSKDGDKSSKKEQEQDAEINRKMNKTSMVKLWIEPTQFQIVKYTFVNVSMDFLPGAWLVHVDNLNASMEMSEAIPGAWLPESISIEGGFSLQEIGTRIVKSQSEFFF